MEIKISTRHILKVLQILAWIIFIGLCVEAGAIIVNTIITLFINPLAAGNFWEGSSYLSGLIKFDRGHFIVITLIMTIVLLLKAIMFYIIVKLFVNRDLDIAQPFNAGLRSFMLNLSYLSLGIGLFSSFGQKYTLWLAEQGFDAADLNALDIEGADVWLFMSVILFVIVQVVKRGVEIQNENDLTI